MLNERIKERRNAAKLTQQALGDAVGVGKSTVCGWEKGSFKPDIELLEVIAATLGTTSMYLMGFTNDPGRKPVEASFPDHPDILPVTIQKIPLLGDIACGEPIYASEDFSANALVGTPIACDFALRCRGDSMVDARILDGDTVFIKKQDYVDDGSIAAVLIDDEATLKRVYHLADGRIELRAANARYAPIIIGGEGETRTVRILGKAVGFQSAFV